MAHAALTDRFSTPLVNLIERFPKGSIWQTRYLCLPLALIWSTRTVSLGELPWMQRLGWLLLGAFTWTLMEYLLHRFVLHWDARTRVGKALMARLHTNHHHVPTDETQVCIPFILAVPLWFGIYQGLRDLGGGAEATSLFVGGLAILSSVYDIVHFASHYGKTPNHLMAVLRRNHMYHHHGDARLRFGVTSPLWDHVFGTWRARDTA